MKKLVLGSDHAGFQLKQKVATHLRAKGLEVVDVGCFDENSVDYPDISVSLAQSVKTIQQETSEQEHFGILCCGSGLGVCIAANRFPWIRAVEAHDHHTATMSRKHNDSNVLCLGGRVIAPELAMELIDIWLATPFDGGRHQQRVDKMTRIQIDSKAQDAAKEIPTC